MVYLGRRRRPALVLWEAPKAPGFGFVEGAEGARSSLVLIVMNFAAPSQISFSIAALHVHRIYRGRYSAVHGGGYRSRVAFGGRKTRGDHVGHVRQHDAREEAPLSPREKVVRWAVQNKYKVVIGSWAASMLGSAAFIFARNPTQTFSQKLVQCRMVAQGATVAVLIASAGLSRIQFDDDAELFEDKPEDAWKQMIEQTPERSPPLGSVHPSHAHNK